MSNITFLTLDGLREILWCDADYDTNYLLIGKKRFRPAYNRGKELYERLCCLPEVYNAVMNKIIDKLE